MFSLIIKFFDLCIMVYFLKFFDENYIVVNNKDFYRVVILMS